MLKRVNDNNHIVDEITLNYYNTVHPFTLYLSNNGNEIIRERYTNYFENQEIKKVYNSSQFFIGTTTVRNKIKIHKQQIKGYMRARDELENKIQEYQSQ